MQNGRWWILAECILDGGKRQLAGVAGSERPTNDLPGFEIQYDRQVVPASVEPQVGEVLHPTPGFRHTAVVHAILRSLHVAKGGVALQDIRRSRNLCKASSARAAFLAGHWDDNAGQRADASDLLLVPPEMQSQSANPVVGVFLVGCDEEGDASLVFVTLLAWLTVVSGAVYAQDASKSFTPSRLDFFQNG